MELSNFIQTHHLQNLAYVILFLGMLFEATFFLFSGMIMVAQNILNPVVVIILVTVGAFTEEVLWYYLGLKLNNWQWLAKQTDRVAKPVDRHLLEHPFHTLLLSKFVYGAHRAILTRAGMLRLGIRRFMKNAFASTGIWLATIGALGYSLGASYNVFKKYIDYAQVVPLVIVVLYFVLDYYISKKLRKNL